MKFKVGDKVKLLIDHPSHMMRQSISHWRTGVILVIKAPYRPFGVGTEQDGWFVDDVVTHIVKEEWLTLAVKPKSGFSKFITRNEL